MHFYNNFLLFKTKKITKTKKNSQKKNSQKKLKKTNHQAFQLPKITVIIKILCKLPSK